MLRDSLSDFRTGLKLWNVWGILALRDIQLSVKRTALGPIWIVLQRVFVGIAFSVFSAVLWATSRSLNVNVLVAYMVFAIMIGYFNSANTALISTGNFSDTGLPISIRLLKPWATEFVLSTVSSLVILIVLFESNGFSIQILLLLALLISLMGIWGLGIILLISPLALRFRDFSQLVGLISILLMFFSPIFWSIGNVKNKDLAQSLLEFNPIADYILAFNYLIERGTLNLTSVFHLSIHTTISLLLGFLCYTICRKKIPYWS